MATGLAQKWVSPNPRNRSTPSPLSCEKIAAALGEDVDYLLELSGHRKPRVDLAPLKTRGEQELLRRQQSRRQQRDEWVRALGPKMGEDAAEAYFWETIKHHEDAVDATLRSMLNVLGRTDVTLIEPTVAVNASGQVAVNAAVSERRKRTARRAADPEEPLTNPYQRAYELVDLNERRQGSGRRSTDQRPAA